LVTTQSFSLVKFGICKKTWFF